MNTEDLCYIRTCRVCGGLLAAATSTCPGLSKVVAKWIRSGDSVDRMYVEEVQTTIWNHAATCSQKKPQKTRPS